MIIRHKLPQDEGDQREEAEDTCKNVFASAFPTSVPSLSWQIFVFVEHQRWVKWRKGGVSGAHRQTSGGRG
jgi:hypothetical protein